MTTIHTALADVMNDVSSVAKADRNVQQGFSFRGIDAVLNAVGPALRRHGVVVLPEVREVTHSTVEVGGKRTPMGHVRVLVAYHFHGPDGDSITAVVPGEAMDSGDKATPKAMSVAFRTALLQSLALPTDEPDPDASSYVRSDEPAVPTLEALLADAQQAATDVALDALAYRAANLHTAGHLTDDDFAAIRQVAVARRQEIREPVPASA